MKFQNGSAHVLIIVAVALIVVGVLGVAFWKNVNQTGSSQNMSSSQTSVRWTTYSKGSLPVSFIHPAEWEIIEIAGRRDGGIRAFKGPRSSSESIVLSIVYRKQADTKVSQSCSTIKLEDVARCERYSTQIMSGILQESKDGPSFTYSSYIGDDLYAVISYSDSVSKEDFKKILQSIKLR
jgi:hypothetical protein